MEPARKFPGCRARGIVALGGLLLLACCATGPRMEGAREPVEIGPGVVLVLPPPGSLGLPVSAAQSVIIRHGNAIVPFEARFSGTTDRVLIVGLDPLGRRTMTLDWTNERIEAATAPWFPRGLPVRNLFADIVMIYWPDEAVRKALIGPDVGLVTDRSRRTIVSGGKEVVRIDYTPSRTGRWSGTAHYRNFARGYSIEVRSVEVPR